MEEWQLHHESKEFGPVFIQEPDHAIFSMDSDDKVLMNCEARGNPAPTYSWLINGTDVDTKADSRYRKIDGNLLIINASEAADFGKYQCRAENSIGTVLSREAFLQFAYVNDFSGRARGAVSVREGQGVVLMCMPPPHSPGRVGEVFSLSSVFFSECHPIFISC
ncbi:contactin-5 [Tachysurus ichikawai]